MAASLPEYIVGETLLPVRTDEISVYVHIPFCSSRCNYCDFYFETTRSPRVIRATLERIVEEAGFFFESMGAPRVRSLYFGGGTPSVVPPDLLDPFLSRLCGVLFGAPTPSAGRPAGDGHGSGARPAGAGSGAAREPVEFTFEANPESVSSELLAVLRDHGCNRLSLGVQSFQDSLLAALTRRADRRSIVHALDLLSEGKNEGAPFRLNVDLMTGIPGQSRKMVKEDIETAASYGADHFSVYSLTVEERTPLEQALARGIRRLPAVDARDSLWLAARSAICDMGFEWYEISNFALPGCRSAHNLGYWRSEPYLGLGPGGVSTIPMQPEGAACGETEPQAMAVRLTNPNLFVYASHLDRGWHHEPELLSPAALLFEQYMTGLRTCEGVPFRRVEEIFSLDLKELWRGRLSAWRKEGLIDEASWSAAEPALVLSPGARLTLDHHLLELRGWIDEIGETPQPRWPAPRRPAGRA